MSSLRDLDVNISAYSPELPSYAYGSRAHPAVGPFMVWGFFGGARRRGERPVFVFEGPAAEEAARRLRTTINKHPSEVLPGSNPGSTLGAKIREQLTSWGGPELVADYDRMQAASKARRQAERERIKREREAVLVWQRDPLQSVNNATWKESPWS